MAVAPCRRVLLRREKKEEEREEKEEEVRVLQFGGMRKRKAGKALLNNATDAMNESLAHEILTFLTELQDRIMDFEELFCAAANAHKESKAVPKPVAVKGKL
uniref:Uncharacterized protein n=1 Tax=Chenopodium quinoa TaxID=63459 RepID=A0A803MDC8_CHEQI